MRVYVESNFVLELVLEQEQSVACDLILDLAVKKSIELVLPAFALLEPYQTIVRKKIADDGLRGTLVRRGKDIQRTASLTLDAEALSSAASVILRAEQVASERYNEYYARIVGCSTIIDIDRNVLANASELKELLTLELPDALVLACILRDGDQRPKRSLFLNKNSKDFNDPDVRKRLAAIDSELITRFDSGHARLQSYA